MLRLRNWIRRRERELIDVLVENLGFKSHQAHDFVRETGKSVLHNIHEDSNLDLEDLKNPTNVVALYNRTDISGVAKRVGVTEDTARSGLKNILPSLLESLDEQASVAADLQPSRR